ncbi:hypothetical protein EAF04_005779 [Stromatinia cepivora]|nr:hypothetical protein EAF04_005779 [Stromatinia cepivora]
MIQNYLSEIRDGYNNIGGRPLLDVENELYDNTKDWGNKGYLSEGYVDLASTLQREAQPVGSIGSCIFQTVAFVVKAMTGVTIVITDFPQRVEVNNRINRLINELCADLSIFMPVEGEYMVNHDLSCPTENRYFIDFKNFMNEDGNHVKRELDRKFPHGPPLLLDFATLRKEIAQRRKRVQTYQREDAETDASQS